MRITIVDRTTFIVMEVIDTTRPSQALAAELDWLEQYRHSDFTWFVTRSGMQPEHAQHNAHGQLLTRAGKPTLSWSK